MKSSILALSLFFLVIPLFASNTVEDKSTKWNFDKSHSSVSFKIRHFFTPVLGSFGEFDGDIYFDPNNLFSSSINVTVDVKSVDTKNDKRDGHLQTADFFEVEKFPKMTFVSSSIEKTGDNEFVAKGKLTIKDVTTDFSMPFKLLGIMDHPMRKGTKISAFESNFMIKRNDYKVGTGQYVETAVIGDEVNVTISLELLSSN